MGYQHLLLLIALIFCASADGLDSSYTYSDYCRQFGKKQDEQKKKIFQKKYQEILDRQSRGQDPAPNQFSDLSPQEKKNYMGRVKNKEFPPSSRPLQKSDALFASPTSYDWRTLGRVSPVKNQGSCGSCWAFAATAQYQSAMAIATNGTIYDLAQQYGVECDNFSSGCGGGDQYTAMRLYNNTGVPLESAYPYKGQSKYYTNLGQNICSNASSRIKLAVNVMGPVRYSTNSIEQIQADLVLYGPASIGVYASGEFGDAGPSGLVSCTYQGSLDHAILLVGYNTTHWFVKNSWGTSWGNNGYAYISKTADCGLSTDVVILKAQYTPLPPPPPPPVVVNITLTVTMTDAGANGWQGNKIAFRQNGVIVGQFGSTFATGSSAGPISITIDGKKSTQIVASALGTNPNQVGFVVKYPNGTVVYTKTAAAYTALTIFNTFCALGGCPTPTINLTITMNDTSGDGWEGTVLGFRQNNGIVGTFGSEFTNNATFGPVYVNIPGTIITQIVPFVIGNYLIQTGFKIQAPNGTIIAQRAPGTIFNSSSILATFCPLGNCNPQAIVKYYVTLTSSCSGWGKNVLGIRQNGVRIANLSLLNATNTTIPFNASQYQTVQIVVSTFGEKTWEVGFVVRTEVGTVVSQRLAGTSFGPNEILASWTPGILNEGMVYNAKTEANEKNEDSEIQKNEELDSSNRGLLISTIVFSCLSGLLGVALLFSLLKMKRMSKQIKENKRQVESAKDMCSQV